MVRLLLLLFLHLLSKRVEVRVFKQLLTRHPRSWVHLKARLSKPNLLMFLLYHIDASNELAGPRATQLLSMKCCCGAEPLATLCSIRLARNLNLKPPVPEKDAKPLDHLTDEVSFIPHIKS